MSRMFTRSGGDWGSALIGAGRGLMDLWYEKQARDQQAAEAERNRRFQLEVRNAAWNREDRKNADAAGRLTDALAFLNEPTPGEGTPGVAAAPASPTPPTPLPGGVAGPAPMPALTAGVPVAGPEAVQTAPYSPDASASPDGLQQPAPPRMPNLRGLRSPEEIAQAMAGYRNSPQYQLYQRNSSLYGDQLAETFRAKRKAQEEADARQRARDEAVAQYQAAVAAGLIPETGLDGRDPSAPIPMRPEDVNHLVTGIGARDSRQAAEANRVRDDARAQQQLEINRQRVDAYVQSVQAKGVPPSEEDIAGLADAIQASNPGIPASQALGIARARLQYKAPMQIPTETLAQKGTREVVKGQLGELRAVRRSLLGPNGRLIARKIGQGMGIPEVPGAGGKTDPDMAKIAEALDGKIGDLEAKLDTVGVAPGGPAPTSPTYQSKAAELMGP